MTTAILWFMSDLRPSFEERDRYVDLLSTAYADGRLDEAEFETRTNAVLSAVSHREALAQFQGLPQPKVVGRRGIMGFALAVTAVVLLGVGVGVGGIVSTSSGPAATPTSGPTPAVEATQPTPERTKAEEAPEPTSEELAGTVSQQNALRKAESYLSFGAFSRSGLIDQLTFEDFSVDDATWAVDRLEVDWNEQAAAKAETYLQMMGFSRQGLLDQLLFEGFTQEQADYGVSLTGL